MNPVLRWLADACPTSVGRGLFPARFHVALWLRRRALGPFAAACVLAWTYALGAARGQDGTAASATAAIVTGTIRYQADPAQPWRYARYYVKRMSSGELAEAVVALRALRSAPAVPVPRPPQTVVIDQKDFTFQPETVVLRQGDAVRFTNSDGATHNVQADAEIARFNVTMPGGGSHTVRFDKAGGTRRPVQVGCVFHSAMRAWIFVFDHPYYQLTGSDGRFHFTHVPPGDYELEVVHPAGGLATRQRLTLRPGQTLQLDIRLAPADKR
jgi:plastocyanin